MNVFGMDIFLLLFLIKYIGGYEKLNNLKLIVRVKLLKMCVLKFFIL